MVAAPVNGRDSVKFTNKRADLTPGPGIPIKPSSREWPGGAPVFANAHPRIIYFHAGFVPTYSVEMPKVKGV